MSTILTQDLTNEYTQLFTTCIIKPEKYVEIDRDINIMMANKETYENVANQLNIPWYFIAIIHCMEASLNFHTHLHNGDPLTRRTVHVPSGRPLAGNPPFTWQESAIDALTIEGFASWTDWSIKGMLFSFEKYNGFGYPKKGINSPYLWSYSNQYTAGKYTADGTFDANAISNQCGAAVLLRRINEKQLTLGDSDIITQIKQIGSSVSYDPENYNKNAEQLQMLLNGVGLHVRIDGRAGDLTSQAYKQIAGSYITGDRRQI